MITLFNNTFIKAEKVNFSVFSPSVQYGYGVFETLRTYNKKIFRLQDHLDRLEESMNVMNLDMKYSKNELSDQVKKVVAKSKFKNQRIKIAVFTEGVCITSTQLVVDKMIYQGVAAVYYPLVRSLPEVKGTFYAPCMLAHAYATEKNAYESILYDPQNGMVSEGAWSNIFWIKNRNIHTTSKGILKGITRKVVLELSAGEVKYATIHKDTLLQADEIFLTQTTKGIVPIIKIEGQTIAQGKVGQFTKTFIKQFKQFTQ